LDRYERQREGLGRELLAEVDAVLAAIARSPIYRQVARELGVGRAAARRFPHAIAFIELTTVVRVLAVAHERRRPGYCMGVFRLGAADPIVWRIRRASRAIGE
jgi:hypothetical protein